MTSFSPDFFNQTDFTRHGLEWNRGFAACGSPSNYMEWWFSGRKEMIGRGLIWPNNEAVDWLPCGATMMTQFRTHQSFDQLAPWNTRTSHTLHEPIASVLWTARMVKPNHFIEAPLDYEIDLQSFDLAVVLPCRRRSLAFTSMSGAPVPCFYYFWFNYKNCSFNKTYVAYNCTYNRCGKL